MVEVLVINNMNEVIKLAIFGNAGHAVDIKSVFLQKYPKGIAFIEKENEKYNVQKYSEDGYGFIIGIGDNKTRQRVASIYKDLNWCNVIHCDSFLHNDSKVGRGCFIGYGIFISHNVNIHNHVIIIKLSVGHGANLVTTPKFVQMYQLSEGVILKSFFGVWRFCINDQYQENGLK